MEALMATVVLPSRVLSSAAATVVSVMVMEKALPVSVRSARVAISPSEMVAVTTPDVAAARVLASVVVASPLLTLTVSSPSPVMFPAVLES